MAKKTCENCGKKYNEDDSRETYNDHYPDGNGYDFDEFFDGRSLCPDCVEAECNEYDSNELPDCDYADIYMSSGEDEDYNFSSSDDPSSHYKE